MKRSNRETTIMEFPAAWGTDEYPHLKVLAERVSRWRPNGDGDEEPMVSVTSRNASAEVLEEIVKAAKANNSAGRAHVAGNILSARAGKDPKISRLSAGPEAVKAWLSKDHLDGWLYKRVGNDDDVKYLPYLVEDVYYDAGSGTDYPATLNISMLAVSVTEERSRYSGAKGIPTVRQSLSFTTPDIKGKSVTDLLTGHGWYHETAELRTAHDERIDWFREVVTKGFAKQFVVRELSHYNRKNWNTTVEHGVRAVMDTDFAGKYEVDKVRAETWDEVDSFMPVYPSVRVFDLKRHNFTTAMTWDMSWYQYHPELRDKLVLPEGHKDLLDVLTTDLDVFTTDIIEGKSAGNVILAKGIPGVGKTLTAEVYSEIVERPLYAVHSGELGTNPTQVREELEKVFKLAKRWDAVLLLDEADVFVRSRGIDITHNAIVAEFLRTLEYFDGLLFMTTNRDDIIDEAIISRCAAIITYTIPEPEDAALIWGVLATSMGITLETSLAKELVTHTPKAAPRDIKMVLRLAARVAAYHEQSLTVEHVRQACMFRGVEWK